MLTNAIQDILNHIKSLSDVLSNTAYPKSKEISEQLNTCVDVLREYMQKQAQTDIESVATKSCIAAFNSLDGIKDDPTLYKAVSEHARELYKILLRRSDTNEV